MPFQTPNLFVNGNAADANEVNENFKAIETWSEDLATTAGFQMDALGGQIDMNSNKILRVATPTNSTDGANKVYVDDSIPVGFVTLFAGTDDKIPPMWVKCDGRALARGTYAELFNTIGVTYGAGDGSSTFNVPNMVGAAATGTPNADGVVRFPMAGVPGALGGSHDAVVVSHNHVQDPHGHGNTFGINGGTHEHTYSRATASGSFVFGVDAAPFITYTATGTTGGGGHSHGITGSVSNGTATNQAAGVSGVNANRPAFLGFNFLIRTGV
jgi:hypothetical protein